MRMYDIITKKKRGEALTAEEIGFFVRGVTLGEIPDYQTASLLMAICLKGMDEEETVFLTESMMISGEVLDLSEFGTRTVDKHSTGGVGDKTSLILGPIVAACGGIVAKMSGRGLGHTGGTVDKMESIPQMQVSLTPERFRAVAGEVGLCIVGQNRLFAPADGKLYALRDVTATVDSIPLIASSILSKKLASGSHSIVLDVKFGEGAFMKEEESAEELASLMVRIGKRLGRRIKAVLTDMSAPLGTAVGNALEVQEAYEVLSGHGPEDLTTLCLTLAGEMLSLALELPLEEGLARAESALRDGSALAKMKEWITAQGGDFSAVENTLPLSRISYTVNSPYEGYLSRQDALLVGQSAALLGAGRQTKEDGIDAGAGIRLTKKIGDRVRFGEPLAVFYTEDETKLPAAEKLFLQGLAFSPRKVKKESVIRRTIS